MQNNIVNFINNEFINCNDLIYKMINVKFKTFHIFYLETICSSDKVNNYILKSISNNNSFFNIDKNIPSPHLIKINNKDKINYYLCNGFVIIIISNKIYAIEAKADLDRSITESTSEASVYGPKDSFVENIQKNLGLIKRRLKTNHIKNDVIIIGRDTKTITNVIYIDNITDKKLISDIEDKLNNIDNDGILASGTLKKFLSDGRNPFPTIKSTERPDLVVTALLQGKIVILLDTSPYALILPSFLIDFLNPVSDNYSKSINSNFLKILRIISFFISIFLPAYYLAITNYNQETIPLPLLINFSSQRIGVPFPAIIEAFIMIIISEILKESDLRFPNSYGSAISILGALVLGEAAVNAGIVSPIMIIVTAITFISSLMFPDSDIAGAIRLWRFYSLILAAFFGLYGVFLILIAFLINIVSYKSMYLNYSFPIEPIDFSYLKDTLFNLKNNKRSSFLSKNITRGKQ